MSGITNLDTLLKEASPKLHVGAYVFTTVNAINGIESRDILMQFREEEGITLIILKSTADKHDLPYEYETAWITFQIHSALEAVGLTAAFSKALADQGLACNVVAGYYHDHVFVGYEHRDQAMEILSKLS